MHSALMAISPLDGRYQTQLTALQPLVSEFGLMRFRVQVEIEWFLTLSLSTDIPEIPVFNSTLQEQLRDIYRHFSLDDALKIKAFEATTNHDVKAIEYFIKDKFQAYPELIPFAEFIHFACTSEDINNLAYALMLQQTREILVAALNRLTYSLLELAHTYAAIPLLSRTHGQPATPTTVGKEFANFVARLQQQLPIFSQQKIYGKLNGAVGNFNAHRIAYPEINWPEFSKHFIMSLGLEPQTYTTQIEPHDWIAEYFSPIMRINSILIDCARDLWGYISLNYFQQKIIRSEVGSSTMPHKVNPIDFENAEGNLRLANSIMNFLSNQLMTSRWQRDLVDSTLLRNCGVSLAHSLLAYQSLEKGLSKIVINETVIHQDLNQHWEILTEAIQTVMRRYQCPEPYEQLKKFSRGQALTQSMILAFIDQLAIPEDAKTALKKLTPHTYLGFATELASSAK
ncbi:MAG: adenylosuccinate lyase [Legionellales bacterium]|nr:adenylosuccinate lyase [Legionellales bacterium]